MRPWLSQRVIKSIPIEDAAMRRIHFISPNLAITHKIVDELRANGIAEQNIHILAKRDTPLTGLPEADVTIKTDFIPAMERGAALGGSVGLLAGLIGLRFAGFTIAGGPVLGILLASATIASLASGLIGLSIGNTRLKQYEEAIDQGEILVLLDIPKDQIKQISDLITQHHPSVSFDGIEPVLPPLY
jgi:hypothetical protein